MGMQKFFLFLGLYLAFTIVMAFIGYHFDITGNIRKLLREPAPVTGYYEMPVVTLKMMNADMRGGSVRLGINLEVDAKDTALVESYLPRIMDRLQAFSQRLTAKDFQETPELRWLRGELLIEINQASGPVHVRGLSFRELIVL